MWNNYNPKQCYCPQASQCNHRGTAFGYSFKRADGNGNDGNVDEIISTLETEFLTLDDKAKTVMRWGKAAGGSQSLNWRKIYRAIGRHCWDKYFRR